MSVTVIACCFLGGRFARQLCQGDDCAVAEACAFAERCCGWGKVRVSVCFDASSDSAYRHIERELLAPARARAVVVVASC